MFQPPGTWMHPRTLYLINCLCVKKHRKGEDTCDEALDSRID